MIFSCCLHLGSLGFLSTAIQLVPLWAQVKTILRVLFALKCMWIAFFFKMQLMFIFGIRYLKCCVQLCTKNFYED